MFGQVTAYAGTSLTINVTVAGGSGTHADWTIEPSGSVGPAGATGAGMQAILFDVSGAYRESGLPRVESLEELEQKV